MPKKNRLIKINKIKAMQTALKDLKTAVLINFSNLSVQKIESLRNNLRKNDCHATVYKNTLLKLAFKKTIYEDLGKNLKGSSLLIYSHNPDSFELIKTTYKFQKKHSNITFKKGFFENKILNKEQILELAQMPSITESLGNLIGLLNSPLTNLVATLQGKIAKMAG